jgi:hypothetical protein
MNLKVFALVTAVALLAGAVAVSNLAQPAMAKGNDKCFTIQNKNDRTDTLTACGVEDEDTDELKDFKKECKDNTDNKEVRCSSSQTGNGFYGNIIKKND